MRNDAPISDRLTVGAVLAGGLARRLGGGDKGLRMVGGRTVLSGLVDRLTPQVTRVVLNANDDPRRFEDLGLPVVADSLPGNPGPLAGVVAALEWTALYERGAEWVVTVPGDAPFIPRDLVVRLHAGRNRDGSALACASSAGRVHPVVALWPVSIRNALRHAVAVDGVRKVETFMQGYSRSIVEWEADPVDPFFNVNTPADLIEADRLATFCPAL